MGGFSFKVAKAGFFDTSKITKAADRLRAQAESKFGAFTRRTMKQSIKYKDAKGRKQLLARIAAERAAAEVAGRNGNRAAGAQARAKVRALRRQLAALDRPTSDPGRPPFAHRGKSGKSPLRELIFFSRDQSTGSVVIGPVQFQGKRGAHALEHGGSATITDPITGKPRSITIRPRPFARPAGEAEAKRFPEILRSLVK